MDQKISSPPSAPQSPLTTSPSSCSSIPMLQEGKPTPLSLDLSSLPPLITPSPPSNTLLITNLNSPTNFHPATLQQVRTLLSTSTSLNSFSPLPSLRRIIISYPTTEATIHMRQILDGVPFGPDDQVKLYFGEHTPVAGLETEDQHLHPPSLGKLLFISPPPSPPMGWEIREEDPPNKDVHAEDLQKALAKLEGGVGRFDDEGVDGKGMGEAMSEEERESLEHFRRGGFGKEQRERSGTGGLMVYHPGDHGVSGDLPKVMVEDTEGGDVREESEERKGKMLTHTARPPVELMED